MKITLPGIMLLSMFSLFSTNLLSQSIEIQKPPLTHHESPEEYAKRMQSVKTFIPTDPPSGTITNLAEFDRSVGAVVAYAGGFGIPMSLIREMAKDAVVTTLVPNSSVQQSVINQYTQARINLDNCVFLQIPTNSYWTRDYGPLYISYGTNQIGIVDFPYNRDRPEDDDAVRGIAEAIGVEWFGMDVIHTGGNYMTDGLGKSASTTIVYEENPSVTPAEVNLRMQNYLGIDDYSVMEDPNNTYIDHIDCWGKYLAPDKVLIRSVPTNHPQYDELEATADYFENKMSSYGTPYKVFRVNTPQDQPYTNSFILNDKVLVPIMNSQYDAQALQVYRDAMPGYKVFGFIGASATPWQSTDALHCRAHEMADLGWLALRHTPRQGVVTASDSYNFTASVRPHSGQPVKADSVIFYYRVNPNPVTPYTPLTMSNTMGSAWYASISGIEEGSTIEYYIFAADESGRREFAPFIGPADAYKFYAGSEKNAQLSVDPGSLTFTAMKDTEETRILNVTSSGDVSVNYTIVPTTSIDDTLTYSLNNSPSPTSYNASTLSEEGWTTLSVSQTANVSNVVISYTWNTDEFYEEGSMWIESPEGTAYRVGYQQLDGNYKIECPIFAGESVKGNWKVWILDSHGDGGHQATNITLKIVKDDPLGDWLTVGNVNGNIAPGNSAQIEVTANAQSMPLGTYEANLTLYSNDEDQSDVVIPVTFQVTVNTAVEHNDLESKIEINPNPFKEKLSISFNLAKESRITIELYNSTGIRLFSTQNSIAPGKQDLIIPTDNLSQGTYLLKVNDGNESASFKLVKSN